MDAGLGIFSLVVAEMMNLGIYGFILPFILAFAITYAILSKSGILGSNKALIGLVSLAVAFMVPILSISGISMGSFFIVIFGFFAFVAAMILAFMMVLALLGIKW